MIHKITSLSNPLVKHLVKLKENSAYRKETQRVLVEGHNLISDLKDTVFHTLLVKDEKFISGIKAKEVFIVDDAVLRKISSTTSPEGLIGELDMPLESPLKNVHSLLALDAVSDPGNLGTLFRTALAFSWSGLYLLPNCCDPFNDKAIRAAKGANFKMAFKRGTWQELEELAIREKLVPLAADLKGEKPEFYAGKRPLLVLGNEAMGLSQEAKHFCKAITLPINPQVESLNVAVAGGILLFLLKVTV